MTLQTSNPAISASSSPDSSSFSPSSSSSSSSSSSAATSSSTSTTIHSSTLQSTSTSIESPRTKNRKLNINGFQLQLQSGPPQHHLSQVPSSALDRNTSTLPDQLASSTILSKSDSFATPAQSFSLSSASLDHRLRTSNSNNSNHSNNTDSSSNSFAIWTVPQSTSQHSFPLAQDPNHAFPQLFSPFSSTSAEPFFTSFGVAPTPAPRFAPASQSAEPADYFGGGSTDSDQQTPAALPSTTDPAPAATPATPATTALGNVDPSFQLADQSSSSSSITPQTSASSSASSSSLPLSAAIGTSAAAATTASTTLSPLPPPLPTPTPTTIPSASDSFFPSFTSALSSSSLPTSSSTSLSSSYSYFDSQSSSSQSFQVSTPLPLSCLPPPTPGAVGPPPSSSLAFLLSQPSVRSLEQSSSSSAAASASSSSALSSSSLSTTTTPAPLAMPASQSQLKSSLSAGTLGWQPYPPSKSALPDRNAPPPPALHLQHLQNQHLSQHHASSQPSPLTTIVSPPSMLPPPPKPKEVKEMDASTLSGLLQQALEQDQSQGHMSHTILLLDVRPVASHVASSIKTAVSICVPNMLLKRPMFSLTNVMDQLTTDSEMERFAAWRQYRYVVLFDATGAIPAVGSPTLSLAQKFTKEGCTAALFYLVGGFNGFAAGHASLCIADPRGQAQSQGQDEDGQVSAGTSWAISAPRPTPTSMMGSLPTTPSFNSPSRPRLHLGSLPSMMASSSTSLAVQTPMFENPNVNPLFESVRMSMGLCSDITEEIPVRVPPGFSVEPLKQHLPPWIRAAVDERRGKTLLAEFFQKVEKLEQKRLALVMAPLKVLAGRTTHFSIGAGIEKGLKNRYNNVWPYDHTRVKIAQCADGTDDYINASYLKSLISGKKYIATQGPLPSTFQDFWKVVWQQDSRVIVMLTREQEMGRIKCHQYWPSAADPTMDLGPYNVRFLSESQPNPAHGTILVRQVKLTCSSEPGDKRTITQIQYTGWPDFGVPDTPLDVLLTIELANKHNVPETYGPMIVHCSAGCGRTGAFCAIDSVLSEMRSHPQQVEKFSEDPNPTLTLSTRAVGGDVEMKDASSSSNSHQIPPLTSEKRDMIWETVNQFREQRVSMVQTLRQFVFCYESILWYIALEHTSDSRQRNLLLESLAYAGANSAQIPKATLSHVNAPITTSKDEFSFFA